MWVWRPLHFADCGNLISNVPLLPIPNRPYRFTRPLSIHDSFSLRRWHSLLAVRDASLFSDSVPAFFQLNSTKIIIIIILKAMPCRCRLYNLFCSLLSSCFLHHFASHNLLHNLYYLLTRFPPPFLFIFSLLRFIARDERVLFSSSHRSLSYFLVPLFISVSVG